MKIINEKILKRWIRLINKPRGKLKFKICCPLVEHKYPKISKEAEEIMDSYCCWLKNGDIERRIRLESARELLRLAKKYPKK